MYKGYTFIIHLLEVLSSKKLLFFSFFCIFYLTTPWFRCILVVKLSELSTLLHPFFYKNKWDVSSASLLIYNGHCFTRKRSSLLDASQHEAICIWLPQFIQKKTTSVGSTVLTAGYVLRRLAEGVQAKWLNVLTVVTTLIAVFPWRKPLKIHCLHPMK